MIVYLLVMNSKRCIVNEVKIAGVRMWWCNDLCQQWRNGLWSRLEQLLRTPDP